MRVRAHEIREIALDLIDQRKSPPIDHHNPNTFAERVKNFIDGTQAIALKTQREIDLGGMQSLPKLSQILDRPSNRI
jgi:hypothetical protein